MSQPSAIVKAKKKYASIHKRNRPVLATDILETKNGLNPVIKFKIKFKNLTYNFRNTETLNRSNVNSVKYRTGTITSLGAKIWKIKRAIKIKELRSLSTFKSKIKN